MYITIDGQSRRSFTQSVQQVRRMLICIKDMNSLLEYIYLVSLQYFTAR